jgi:DDE superfamily endonuclease
MLPGSTSDCLSVEGMTLFNQLEEGLLEPGLCLFGDNAYLNAPYMATPYPNTQGGSKDAYNFYHSQVRIRIECAFGMLTNRWGMLRSAIPLNVTIQKTSALVVALAKLHNYCIDSGGGQALGNIPMVEWRNEVNGVILLVVNESNASVIPQQLLGGGAHFDDIGNRQRRYAAPDGMVIPREKLYAVVSNGGLVRLALLLRR